MYKRREYLRFRVEEEVASFQLGDVVQAVWEPNFVVKEGQDGEFVVVLENGIVLRIGWIKNVEGGYRFKDWNEEDEEGEGEYYPDNMIRVYRPLFTIFNNVWQRFDAKSEVFCEF